MEVGFRTIKDIAPEIIIQWLEEAKQVCKNIPSSSTFGGTVFDDNCKQTYWSDVKQFLTWWKNNVERTSKRDSYLKESVYEGSDRAKKAKAAFCLKVLSLSNDITMEKKSVKQSSKKSGGTKSPVVISSKSNKSKSKINTKAITNATNCSDEFTNLLNVAMAYEANENINKKNPKTNDDDKDYNTKRKAIDIDNPNNSKSKKSNRPTVMTEEQEEFLSSLSSLSSPASAFSTPSSLSKFAW